MQRDDGSTPQSIDFLTEARICVDRDSQPVLGVGQDDQGDSEASQSPRPANSVVMKERPKWADGRFVKLRNEMDRCPFNAVANRVLRDRAARYAKSTREERKRKIMRVHAII